MKRSFWVSALAFVTVLAMPAVASAHVVVKPARVPTAAFQTFTTSVPNEKSVAVTGLRLVIPAGVKHVTPTVKNGWQITTKKSGENVTEITWSAGSIPAGFRDDFTFSAQAPGKTSELHWKAYQSYEDGSTVSWDEAPSSGKTVEGSDSGPYSTTKVVDKTAKSSKSSASNASGAYALAGVALALSIVAFITSRRKH